MSPIEPSKDKVPVDSKPLFASTWVALFSVLRKNYNERHAIDATDAERLTTPDWQQSEKKHN